MYPRSSSLGSFALLVFILLCLAGNSSSNEHELKLKNEKQREINSKESGKKKWPHEKVRIHENGFKSIFPDINDKNRKFMKRSYYRDDAENIEPMAYVHIQSSYPPLGYNNRKCGRCVIVYKPCSSRKPGNYPKPPRILLPSPNWRVNKYGE